MIRGISYSTRFDGSPFPPIPKYQPTLLDSPGSLTRLHLMDFGSPVFSVLKKPTNLSLDDHYMVSSCAFLPKSIIVWLLFNLLSNYFVRNHLQRAFLERAPNKRSFGGPGGVVKGLGFGKTRFKAYV